MVDDAFSRCRTLNCTWRVEHEDRRSQVGLIALLHFIFSGLDAGCVVLGNQR